MEVYEGLPHAEFAFPGPLRVDSEHARDEGGGYDSVSEWRAGHEAFWHSTEMRDSLGDAAFTVTDGTLVVLERFRLVHRLGGTGAPRL